jgi:hypothetical protein
MIRAQLSFVGPQEMIYAQANRTHEHLRGNSFTIEVIANGVDEGSLPAIDISCRNLSTLPGSVQVDHQ